MNYHLKYNRFLNHYHSKVWDKHVFHFLTISIVYWCGKGGEIIIPTPKDTFKIVSHIWFSIEMKRWIFWSGVCLILSLITWVIFK
jgi:hypothetical protein